MMTRTMAINGYVLCVKEGWIEVGEGVNKSLIDYI